MTPTSDLTAQQSFLLAFDKTAFAFFSCRLWLLVVIASMFSHEPWSRSALENREREREGDAAGEQVHKDQ